MKRPSGVFVLAALFGAAFLWAGATRRLHFDEALALRAGWLLAAREPAEPPFAMPLTLAAGAAAHAVADPGALFTLLRLATGVAVLGALAFAVRRARGTAAAAAFTAALALVTYAFPAHGIEFRYDAAILVGLLLSFGFLARGEDADYAPLGAAAALVASHHVKGLLFGAAVLVFGVVRASGDRRRLARLVLGFLAAAAAWVGVAAACGALPDAAGTVAAFARLGAGTARKAPWATPVARTLQLDAAFWLAALVAAAGSVRAVARRGAAWREEPAAWALLFLGATFGFTFVHPAPWPYMLALPIPFAAILVASRVPAWLEKPGRPALLAAALAAVLLQTFAFDAPVGAAYWTTLAAPRAPEVEALRAVRRLAAPGDRVFDPSGVVYFLPPCTREWYLDSLFEPRARAGAWMADAGRLTPAACPWVLVTYRIGMLPDDARARIAAGWDRRRWGLALGRGDPRLSSLPPPARDDEINTFW